MFVWDYKVLLLSCNTMQCGDVNHIQTCTGTYEHGQRCKQASASKNAV